MGGAHEHTIRAEVLRGLHGTLYGASAERGAIRLVTPEPDLHVMSGYDRAELASTDRGDTSYETGVAAGVPPLDIATLLNLRAGMRWSGLTVGYRY